ncbi:hypothetical protein BKA70DRAFT_1291152 [Coprinopsis sp. MPI-PUGE-AT-0042]|nr:hypothetical protein BKA70DRAFT_1291152 [Coprinopsis sp. MPI-PUGE-AT-0042]
MKRIKRQASALVKSTSAEPDPSASAAATSSWRDNSPYGTRLMGSMRRPFVSFAPTPPHSLPRTSTSTTGTNSSIDDCSFLDYDDDERSFGLKRLKHGKSLPVLSLFRNRNTNFVHNGSSIEFPSSERPSICSTTTTDTTVEPRASTDSSDFIPFIPLVLQKERSRMQAAEASRDQSRGGYDMSSPRTSCSDGSESTPSPITPKTPIFLRPPSVLVTSDEDDDSDAQSYFASFAGRDSQEYDERYQKSDLGPFAQSSRRHSARETPFSNSCRFRSETHPYAQGTKSDDDSISPSQTPISRNPYQRDFEDDKWSLATTSESSYSEESLEPRRRSSVPAIFDPVQPRRPSGFSLETERFPSIPFGDGYSDVESVAELRRSSLPSLPPAIRVRAPSTVASEEPTPTIPNSRLSNFLLPPKRCIPKRQPKIGVGRQTVDPHGSKEAANKKEWTLLLGVVNDEKVDTEQRPRVQSVGSSMSAKGRISALQNHARARTQSGSSVRSTLPFRPEEHIQKPLLRMKSGLDLKTSFPSAAGPVVNIAHNGGNSSQVGDTVDWTLMLPLPISHSQKASAHRFSAPNSEVGPSPIATSTSNPKKRAAERKKVPKARSSIDLTAGMNKTRWDNEDPFSKATVPLGSLDSIKKELEKLEEAKNIMDDLARRREAKEREGAREEEQQLLAALMDASGQGREFVEGDQWLTREVTWGLDGEAEFEGRESVVDYEEREDHRRRAFETLSGRPSLDIPRSTETKQDEVARSTSPGLSQTVTTLTPERRLDERQSSPSPRNTQMRKSSPSIPLPPVPTASSAGAKGPSHPTAQSSSKQVFPSSSAYTNRPRQSTQLISSRMPIGVATGAPQYKSPPIGGSFPSMKKHISASPEPLSPKSGANPFGRQKTKSPPRPGSRDTIVPQRRKGHLTNDNAPIQEYIPSSDSDAASISSFKSCSSTDTIVPPTSRRGSPDSRSQIVSESESTSSTSSFARRVHEFPLPPTFTPTPESPERNSSRSSGRYSRSPNGRHPSSPQGSLNSRSAASSPAPSARTSSPRRPASILDGNRGSSGWDDEGDQDSGSEDEAVYMSMSDEDYEDAVSMMSGMYYSARTSLEF